VNEILPCTEIPFGRLDRSVPKQQLNLLKLATGGTAQFGARPTVMPHAA